MDPPLFGGHIGALDALSHLMLSILTITNAIIIGTPYRGKRFWTHQFADLVGFYTH
jgi:hypothetical protein